MHARRQDHTDGLPGWAQDWCVVSLGLAAGTAAAYRPAAPASGASHFLDCRANQLPVLDATEGCITGDMLGAMAEVTEAGLFLLAAAGGLR